MPPIDLTGQRFVRLAVIGVMDGRDANGRRVWNCICDCGRTTSVATAALRSGNTRSCGCLQRDVVRVLARTHGKNGTGVYRAWRDMLGRCNKKSGPTYRNYTARGIVVCDRWRLFENFYADMGDRPPNMSLDRINNDGNYEPGNCRWATTVEQACNKRSSVIVTFEGQSKTLAHWADYFGITRGALRNRYMRNGTLVPKRITSQTKGWPR